MCGLSVGTGVLLTQCMGQWLMEQNRPWWHGIGTALYQWIAITVPLDIPGITLKTGITREEILQSIQESRRNYD
jgi:hypothetical protein